jgi:beta-galactosidase
MRTIIPLDHSWFFRRGDEAAWIDPSFGHAGWDEVTIPRSNLELPWNDFDEKCYQFVSTWLRDFSIAAGTDELASGRRRVFVDFEATIARVFVNGKEAGVHEGGYTPFSFEIGDLVHFARTRSRDASIRRARRGESAISPRANSSRTSTPSMTLDTWGKMPP